MSRDPSEPQSVFLGIVVGLFVAFSIYAYVRAGEEDRPEAPGRGHSRVEAYEVGEVHDPWIAEAHCP